MVLVQAVEILHELDDKHASLKSLIHKSDSKEKRQLYAVVCETLKFRSVLDELIDKTRLSKEVKRLKNDPWLARVLTYSFLFGSGLYGKHKDVLSKHKSALRSELARMKIMKKVMKDEDLLDQNNSQIKHIPRYVRVNTLKLETRFVIQTFVSEGYQLKQPNTDNYSEFIDGIRDLKNNEFMVDLNMPDLLIFAPSTDLHLHKFYLDGSIILQDKASCLPAFVLKQSGLVLGAEALDSCAAPGNKTSQLAAYFSNKGKILAFDKDGGRLKTMNNLLKKAGVTNVHTFNEDFLKTDPNSNRFRNVRYAIVDPSCSGSGIVSRLNSLTDNAESSSEERIENLSQFQRHILKHVLSFPRMERVVYSTCSVHVKENEEVVQHVCEQTRDRFEVVEILPDIPSRGLDTHSEGTKCVRLSSETDATNGFFVACFQRKKRPNEAVEEEMDTEETENNATNASLVGLEGDCLTKLEDIEDSTVSGENGKQVSDVKTQRKKRLHEGTARTNNGAEQQNPLKRTIDSNTESEHSMKKKRKKNKKKASDVNNTMAHAVTVLNTQKPLSSDNKTKSKQKKKKKSHNKPVTSK